MGRLLRPGERDDDRHDRTRLIPWVKMDRIREARVLVAGAGALGNEALKDLVLFGFRRIDVMDMDTVVRSNLSRCVLFREGDQSTGRGKAGLAAERAKELDPEADVRGFKGKVESLDPSALEGYDLILGCLDNVAARLHLNANAYYAAVPYVDGGTDGFRGRVQVVNPPLTPCLQCGMNRTHFKVMERRFSCTGQDTVYYQPKLAAEITTTSVIAAVQVREAVKVLCDRGVMEHVMFYDGLAGTCDVCALEIDPLCPNHARGRLS